MKNIIWHVSDLNFSHVEKDIVKDTLIKLNDKFEKETPLMKNKRKS